MLPTVKTAVRRLRRCPVGSLDRRSAWQRGQGQAGTKQRHRVDQTKELC